MLVLVVVNYKFNNFFLSLQILAIATLKHRYKLNVSEVFSLNIYIIINPQMFNFSSIVQNIVSNRLVTNISDQYNKIKHQISKQYQITEVISSLYHIAFPDVSDISQLLFHVAGCKYMLMNIGEYPYEVQFVKKIKQKNENGKLKHIFFQYYSSIPFQHLIQNMQEVKEFIQENKNNKVYIICQENSIRSAVFLSCYIYMNKLMGIEDIGEAILYVNQKLSLSLEEGKDSSLYKNHHALFKNIMHYATNPQFINNHQLSLLKISIKNAPKIKMPSKSTKVSTIGIVEIKLAIQIRCGSNIIHKSIYNEPILQGESIFIDFIKQNKNIHLSDEFLIIVKYIYEKKSFNVLRIQLNTNFIFNQFARVHQQDIDLSAYCQVDKKDIIFVDFQFQNMKELSELANRNEQKERIKKELVPNKNKKDNNNNFNLLQGQGVHQEAKTKNQNDVDNEMHFDWFNQTTDLDDNDINSKIQQVMKTLHLKEEERVNDKKLEEEEKEQDMDDYLKNLQSQAE